MIEMEDRLKNELRRHMTTVEVDEVSLNSLKRRINQRGPFCRQSCDLNVIKLEKRRFSVRGLGIKADM